jgi:hypothetical protein
MLITFLIILVASVLLGLCISQLDATDRELRYQVKYHNLYYNFRK